jgi:predicted AlkP superfamily pyrophosphatase or phosphodiesterase
VPAAPVRSRLFASFQLWVIALLIGGWVLLGAAFQGQPRPILILISFDGWRWDYMDRADVPNLKALARRGIRSRGLIPSFPSKTFPNHYTLVTGLYPDHHGIISNNMWDPVIGERFTMSAGTATDPRWWAGEPLWVTAIRQGQRASAMFWPGSEVQIDGIRPTDWKPFADNFPNRDRVAQVLTWLSLPEAERPSFMTLYFSDVDDAGHTYGPDARKTLDAAEKLDVELGTLLAGIEARGLTGRTTVIATADHGMSQQAVNRKIFIDDYVDPATIDVIDWSPVLQVRPTTGSVDDLYRRLRGKHPALRVYRKSELPAALHYGTHPRIAPIVALADDGWAITTHARFEPRKNERSQSGGEHGYDPRNRSMHALFVAAGPTLRRGLTVAPFENVHVYEFLCGILGLKPARNDGSAAVTKSWTGHDR